MLKNILIIVFLVIGFNALFVFSGGLDKLVKTEQAEEQKIVKVDPNIVDVFRFTLQEEVKKKTGQPIEGYEPQMFLQVFPGLTETDFENVEAVIGYYVIKNGRLEHELGNTGQPVHSASSAIDRDSYATILNNVADRSGIDLKGQGTITDIVSVITAD